MPSSLLDVSLHLLQLVLTPGRESNVCPTPGEFKRHRSPDSIAPAGQPNPIFRQCAG